MHNWIDIDSAVGVFVRGFAFTRSFTHPYRVERHSGVWRLTDSPRHNPADYRREEYVAFELEPAEVDRIARSRTRGGFAVCAIRRTGEPDAPLRSAYKSLGYRLTATESFMAHRLRRVPKVPAPLPVRRVNTQERADRLARVARSRQVLPEHFGPDSVLRQYVALDGDRPVGWVRSIVVQLGGGAERAERHATWVSNMHVEPRYRRLGIGKSLLARMLRDDRTGGAEASFLLASHSGALLYPHVGYELIGELLVFTPKKSAGYRGGSRA